ncbi:MAG: type II secretion system protein N [Proteobacteria bacterium]|nr:type II secretion system protein N [Pseudomonadota bacterium]
MASPKRLILAGIATLVIGLISTFPARVAYQWFAPGELKLGGISGSIWRGAAAQGSAGGVYLTNIKWRFRPLGLLTGKLQFATSGNPASGFFDADIALGAGGSFTLSDVAAAVPLSALADAFPLSGIEGDVSLQFEELVIKGGVPVEATGTINIANLVSRYLAPTPLGDFRAEFQTADDGILGSVEAVSGVLELAGTIRLTQDRNFKFVGQVAAKPNAPLSITQQLQFLGTPNSRGQREFRLEGQL